MGILNVTPDSRFGSDYYQQVTAALQRAEQMIAEGATIIDVGGESTKPGALPVSEQEELDRVMPVIEGLTQRTSAIISVDTRKAAVMQAAIAAGVHMINDVEALATPVALSVVANSNVAVCLMHMQNQPQSMQLKPHYVDVVMEVKNFLLQQVRKCLAAGIASDRILIDPGFGFGKTLQHNLQLLKHLQEFTELKIPVLVGLSRKSMLEQLLGLAVEQRLYASIALAVLAVSKGAVIVRTHDVRPTFEAIKTAAALCSPL